MGLTFALGLMILLPFNQSVHPWWICNKLFYDVIWLKGTLGIDRGAVWMWCTIQGIFMLCVMNVVTTMVISTDIGTHDKLPNIKGAIDGTHIMIKNLSPLILKIIFPIRQGQGIQFTTTKVGCNLLV